MSNTYWSVTFCDRCYTYHGFTNCDPEDLRTAPQRRRDALGTKTLTKEDLMALVSGSS